MLTTNASLIACFPIPFDVLWNAFCSANDRNPRLSDGTEREELNHWLERKTEPGKESFVCWITDVCSQSYLHDGESTQKFSFLLKDDIVLLVFPTPEKLKMITTHGRGEGLCLLPLLSPKELYSTMIEPYLTEGVSLLQALNLDPSSFEAKLTVQLYQNS